MLPSSSANTAAAADSDNARSLDDLVRHHSKISMSVNAADLESSIKAFCDTADLHLEKLHDLHNDAVTRPTYPVYDSYVQQTIREEWNPNSHSKSNVNRRANTSMNKMHTQTSANNSATGSISNNHLDASMTTAAESPSLARKVDLLMRRQKMMEERLKETQGSNERLVEDFAAQSEVMRRMADTHRNDRRLIGLLSEQVESLKSDREMDFKQLQASKISVTREEVESIVNEMISKFAAVNQADFEQVKLQLKDQLQKAFANQLRAAVDNVVKEQQIILTKWTEQYNANLSIPKTLGKELASFQDSIKSIAMRQSTSDASLAKFSESLIKQEDRITIILHESLDKYRGEIQAVLDSVGRKVNDHLSTLTQHVDSSVSTSLGKVDDMISSMNQKLLDEQTIIQAVSRRLTQLEIEQKDGTYQISSKLNSTLASVVKSESLIDKCSYDIEQLEGKISLLKFEISEAEAASRNAIDTIVDSVDGTRAFCESSIQMLSNSYTEFEESTAFAVQEAVAQIETPVSLSKQNADGLQLLRSLLDDKFATNSDELETYKEELGRTISTLFESDRKTRTKIKEIYDQFTSVSQTRGAVERVLNEVNERSKEDSVWTYHFKNLAEALDGRLKAVEKTVPQSLSSLQGRLFDIENKVASLRSGRPQGDVSVAPSSSSGEVAKELAAAMQEMALIRNDVRAFLHSHEKKKSTNCNEQALVVDGVVKERLDDYEKRLLVVESFIVRTSEDIMNDASALANEAGDENPREREEGSIVEDSSSSKASRKQQSGDTITISNTHLNTIINTNTNTFAKSNPSLANTLLRDGLEDAKKAMYVKKSYHRERFRRQFCKEG